MFSVDQSVEDILTGRGHHSTVHPAQVRLSQGVPSYHHPATLPLQSGALSLVQIYPDTLLSLVQICPDTLLSLVQIYPDTLLLLVDTLLRWHQALCHHSAFQCSVLLWHGKNNKV